MNQPVQVVSPVQNYLRNTPKSGSIEYENGKIEFFTATSPARANKCAMEIIGARCLSRRNLIKFGVRTINFNGIIAYPVKNKRTLNKRRDRHVNANRPPAPKMKKFNFRQKNRRLPKAA